MPNKIRVLLVDDNDETRDGTKRLLEYEDDIEIVDFADNGLMAIEKAKELQPDVILMDINMPVMDGLTATQRLQVEAPRCQVIIVSVQDDPNYMRQAIRAGAVDFVAKPISSDEMAESIRRAYAKRPAEVVVPGPGDDYGRADRDRDRGRPQGVVITVVGTKGGVGKTTIAVNLAVGLARAKPGARVLIVDGSLHFGDVAVFLNTRGQYNVVDMVSMAEVPEEIDSQSAEVIMVSHESGVKLLVSPPNPGEAGAVTSDLFVNMLNYLKTLFDYIVVDTATMFDQVLIGAIQGSDRLLMLTTATMPALKDAKIVFSELTAAEYQMDHVLLVLNMFDKNSRITADQIANFLKHPVALQIPVDPNANEAVNRGIALITLDPRRTAAVRPLMDLVQLVIDSVEKVEVEDREGEQTPRGRTGPFSRLRGG